MDSFEARALAIVVVCAWVTLRPGWWADEISKLIPGVGREGAVWRARLLAAVFGLSGLTTSIFVDSTVAVAVVSLGVSLLAAFAVVGFSSKGRPA